MDSKWVYIKLQLLSPTLSWCYYFYNIVTLLQNDNINAGIQQPHGIFLCTSERNPLLLSNSFLILYYIHLFWKLFVSYRKIVFIINLSKQKKFQRSIANARVRLRTTILRWNKHFSRLLMNYPTLLHLAQIEKDCSYSVWDGCVLNNSMLWQTNVFWTCL